MVTNIILSLDLRRPKEDGSYPIMYRLTHNRKTTSISSGYSTPKKYWDNKNRCLKNNYPGTDSPQRLNNYLMKRKAQLIDIITRLKETNELKFLSIKQLKERLDIKATNKSVYTFIELQIRELIKAKRIGTAATYEDVERAIKRFRKQKDLTFNELNLDFLKKYEVDFLSRGNTYGGLAVFMRTTRAIFNKAIKSGYAEEEGYPFKHYTIRSSKPRKRAISMEAIQKIKDLKLDKSSPLFIDRYIFLMSFYLRGMPFTDMANLKVSNIVDGRVQYARQKTGQPLDMKIIPQLMPIINYFTEGKNKDDYILPVIKRGGYGPVQGYPMGPASL